jgi:iron complex outermembrane receptor protein
MAPIKNLSVLLGLHTRDLKGSARLFRANIIKPGSNDLVAGFDPSKVSYDGVNSQDVSATPAAACACVMTWAAWR